MRVWLFVLANALGFRKFANSIHTPRYTPTNSRSTLERPTKAGTTQAEPRAQRLDAAVRYLEQACERYEAAWRLQRDNAAVLYNWGVAMSDIALALKVWVYMLVYVWAHACMSFQSNSTG